MRRWSASYRRKLQDYIRDPDAFDNQGLLKNAPSPEIRRRIIDSRIRNIEKEIEVFEKNIKDLGGTP